LLNFGQIRERYENITGESIATASLASRIDKAQIEIAKMFGKRSEYWYPPYVAELEQSIGKEDTTLHLDSTVDMPEPPATAYLGTGPEAEGISYGNIVSSTLQDVQRGVEGTEPNEWPAGTGVRFSQDAGTEHGLPDDYLIVHEVRGTDNMPEFGYYISEQMRIAFYKEGLYKLIYTPVPEPIEHTDNAAVPEVHPVFHEDIITFCVAKHWEEIAEGIQGEEQKALNLKQQFYRNIEESARTLKWNVNQQYTIGIKLWS